MEEKASKIRNSLWPFSGFGFFNKLFFRTATGNKTSGNDLKKGFTLVELLVVISMVGVLATATIALINPIGQIKNANDGKRKSELKQIQSGLEIYRADVGGYPIDTAHHVQNSGQSLVNLTDSSVVYIQNVPKDPKSSADYYYCTQASCGATTNCGAAPCSSYIIYACAEKGSSDPEAKTPLPSGLSCSSLNTSYYYSAINP